MRSRSEHEKIVEARLAELERDIDAIQDEIQKSRLRLNQVNLERAEKLKRRKQEARLKLQELREAGDDAWDDLKEGVEDYWKALGNEVKAFDSFFRE